MGDVSIDTSPEGLAGSDIRVGGGFRVGATGEGRVG